LASLPFHLFDQYDGDPVPLSEIAKRAIKEDCLIVITGRKVRAGPLMLPHGNFRAIRPPQPLPVIPAMKMKPAPR
jgi:hypothetical protein